MGDLATVVLAQPPRKRRQSRWQPADLFEVGMEGNSPNPASGKLP